MFIVLEVGGPLVFLDYSYSGLFKNTELDVQNYEICKVAAVIVIRRKMVMESGDMDSRSDSAT